jgi:ferredoxin/flavodoxin
MKTILYYFTGTGNSLATAKKIADTLEDCELVPIASMMETSGDIIPQAERVGIIAPVYFAGLPDMVASFARRLDLTKVLYTFSVQTYGGGGAESALAQLDKILRRRSGRGLSAGYFVLMPGNYILMYESATGEKRDKILTSADAKIQEIVEEIVQCKEQPLPRSFLSWLMHTLVYSWFISHAHNKDRNFSVNDECTSCGICTEICPAHNIELVNKKPVWKHHCELCCGCIHLCPVKAIQAGKKTIGRARYKNPDVKISELRNTDAARHRERDAT